jgi:diguanylate cyclase (GGDEF)-like protein/PAS domain S-box-containing protein
MNLKKDVTKRGAAAPSARAMNRPGHCNDHPHARYPLAAWLGGMLGSAASGVVLLARDDHDAMRILGCNPVARRILGDGFGAVAEGGQDAHTDTWARLRDHAEYCLATGAVVEMSHKDAANARHAALRFTLFPVPEAEAEGPEVIAVVADPAGGVDRQTAVPYPRPGAGECPGIRPAAAPNGGEASIARDLFRQMFAGAMKLAGMGAWRLDMAQGQYHIDDQMFALLGTTRKREGGLRISREHYSQQFIHPDDALPVAERIDQHRTLPPGSEFTPYEHRIVRRDGQVRILRVHSVGVWDDAGRLTRLHGINLDVTEFRDRERVLMESNAALTDARRKLSLALELASMSTWEYDVAADRFLFNDHFYKLLGTDARSLGGYRFTVREAGELFFDADGRAQLWERIEAIKAAAPQSPLPVTEVRFANVDSEQRIFLSRKAGVWNQGGKLTRICGVLQDVTYKRKAEAILAGSELRYRTLVANSPIAITRWDKDIRRSFVNPASCRFYGQTEEQLLGTTPEAIPGGAYGEYYRQAILDVFASDQPGEVEFCCRENGRGGQVALTRLSPEHDDAGGVASVLALGLNITEQRQSRERIHQLSYYDHTTGLPNKRRLRDASRQALAEAAKQGTRVALMLVDPDHFKLILDNVGFAGGDRALGLVAERLKACLRDYDTVARIGGDKFAVLLPHVRTPEDAGTIAAAILQSFASPLGTGEDSLSLTVSIGVAVFPEDATNVDDLMSFADTALNHAKTKGRNNFQCYSPELTARARERLKIANALRFCVENRELELYYQPKVEISTQRVTGAEALLRWKHPPLGLVTPDRFIGIAEDRGYIVGIGEWVLESAFAAATAWNTGRRDPITIAVNMSPRQLREGDPVATVRRVLENTGCQPDWIELEITESLLLDAEDMVLQNIVALRTMGFTIAIDDFGTGYSALNYLTRFPIDTIKVDRSFMSGVCSEHAKAVLVRAIASLAGSLDMGLVAEGVENHEQAAFLDSIGCRLAQGYLYGKPMPKAEFDAILMPVAAPC